MSRIFRAIGDELKDRFNQKDAAPVNSYEGFTRNGAVVLRDRRGTAKAEIPNVDLNSEMLGDDPVAIYKPTCANMWTPQRRWATSLAGRWRPST